MKTTFPGPEPVINTDKILLSVVDMEWCEYGVAYARSVFKNLEVLCWDTGDPYPSQVDDWEATGSYPIEVISYSRNRPSPAHEKERSIFIPHRQDIAAWAAIIAQSIKVTRHTDPLVIISQGLWRRAIS